MIAFERIKKLAKKQHLSLVQVNDKANLGTRTIYHWKDKEPSNNNLAAVAKVLHTTTDYLNGTTDNPAIPTDDDRTVSLDEDKPYSYRGYPVPDRYLKMVRSLMDDDIKEGRAKDDKKSDR